MLRHETKYDFIVRVPNAREIESFTAANITPFLENLDKLERFVNTPAHDPLDVVQHIKYSEPETYMNSGIEHIIIDDKFYYPSPSDRMKWIEDFQSRLYISITEEDMCQNPLSLMPLLEKMRTGRKDYIRLLEDWREEENAYITVRGSQPMLFRVVRPYLYVEPSKDQAVLLPIEIRHRFIWLYQESDIYSTDEDLTPEEATALADEIIRKKRRKIDRAQSMQGIDSLVQGKRQAIPDDVKMFVWQRDEGRCVNCDSNIDLEFDHIIPLSMGGSNTARNLQLLCASCNQAKGGSLV